MRKGFVIKKNGKFYAYKNGVAWVSEDENFEIFQTKNQAKFEKKHFVFKGEIEAYTDNRKVVK